MARTDVGDSWGASGRHNVPGVVLLALLAAACDGGTKGGNPGAPSPSGPRSGGERFEVTGVVTNEAGEPVANVPVTMRYNLMGFYRAASAVTDAAGRYAISFNATPTAQAAGRLVARAEIVVTGATAEYDWYYRSLYASTPSLREDFRLRRIRRIAAGESIVVPIDPDAGDCLGWLLGPCGRLRVRMPAAGDLTIEAVPQDETAAQPAIEVCCVGGDERGGNPVTIPVDAGNEIWVELGQPPGAATGPAALVKTSAHAR